MRNNVVFKVTNENGIFFIAGVKDMIECFKEYSVQNNLNYIVFDAGEIPFNELPENVQNEAMETLKAFKEVHITYERGEFHVETGVALKSNYYFDFFAAGTYKDTEIFTDEERRQNFFDSFGYFPNF